MPEPSTRLFLILPAVADAHAFKPTLAATLAAGDIACVLLPTGPDSKTIAQALMPLVQERDAAFLIEGDPRLAARIGADGVHVAYAPDAVEAALSSLGTDAIVGAGALASRDDAMSAGELGASYVMFGESDAAGLPAPADDTLARVAWWAEIFNVPCVAYAASLDDVGPLAEARAEFIALGDAVWKHSAGPANAVERANALLANAVLTA
ncbi:MAG: thiamine phosphate synthase [Methylobacteriaceae bacterium]|nr:thiamine phosphate synthase [Methylobacteriaceae bacterium]